MPNFTEYGYNSFLQKGIYVGREDLEDDLAIKISQVPKESVSFPIEPQRVLEAINQLYTVSSISSGAAMISNNSGARVITTVTNPLAICESTVYKTSISSNNQIPYGSDAIANGHKSHSGYDISDNSNSNLPGTGLTYIHHIENQTGSGSVYYFLVRWRFIGGEQRPTGNV